jgi:hypothetical protein
MCGFALDSVNERCGNFCFYLQEDMMREKIARRSNLEVIWLLGSVYVKSSLVGSGVARVGSRFCSWSGWISILDAFISGPPPTFYLSYLEGGDFLIETSRVVIALSQSRVIYWILWN